MAELRVVVTKDAHEFAQHAGGFLARRPIEHNVLATVVASLDRSDSESAPLFAWVQASEHGELSAAALRTPSRPLLASTMDEESAEALMARLLEAAPSLPGVNGPQPAASHLADAWRRRTGGTVEPGRSQGIYSLSQVREVGRQPGGRPRLASRHDRELLREWYRAFSREVGDQGADVDSHVDRRLVDGELFVWDDERVVCMVGAFPPVAGAVRLAPVYTPPDLRRRGYASALVAEVSRRALATNAEKCMLYTDLANQTSNSIYQAVGYRRSNDAQEYLFSCW
jgi:predicted GNAT family acetyltransferase